jgi:hypothetical protein
MSKELSLFASDARIPAYLIDNGASATTAALAGGSDSRRISIKGSVFRMIVGGQELAVNEDRSMNFIVVGAAPTFARTFYDGEYVDGVDSSPVCWSDDGVSPAGKAPEPQAKSCATCPQNIKGSGKNNSRACRYSARLAVVLDGDIEGGVYGINIPATSIFGEGAGRYSSLQEYARKLAGFKIAIERVITEFKFDVKSPVPKLLFQAVRPITKEELEVVNRLVESSEVADHIGPRSFDMKRQDRSVEGTPFADDADDEVEAPPAKTAKATRAAKPAPVVEESEEELDAIFAEPTKRTKPAAAAKPQDDSEDELKSLIDDWADD